jgi:malate synthase
MYWTGRHLGLPTGNTKHNVAYVREDIAQAQIGAAVKAERERCRKLAAARADYLEDAIHNGSGSKTLIASQKGGMIELRHIAAAIRKGEQP